MSGEYPIPPEIIELRRVAYNDITLEPSTTPVLQGRDHKWLTRTGLPECWTSNGLPSGQFRLWPTPQQSDATDFAWDSDVGITVRFRDASGTNYTLIPDPNVLGWSAENGLLTILDSVATTTDDGEIFSVTSSASQQITLWGTKRPENLSGDDTEIPIRKPWIIAVLWYMLWQIYEMEGDLQNGKLSAYYRDQFLDQVERCRKRVSNTVPARISTLRGGETNAAAFDIGYGDLTIGGVSLPTIWGN